jgi:hypothetical protein
MATMKGPARVLARAWRAGRHIELLGFADGSWGIRRDGAMLGTWEAGEDEECITALFQLIGTPPPVIRVIGQTAVFVCPAPGSGPGRLGSLN